MVQSKFYVVYNSSSADTEEDRVLIEMFCTQLNQAGFEAEARDIQHIKEKAPGFHFLFCSGIDDYFKLCQLANFLKIHSSALSEDEIANLKKYVTGGLETLDTEGLGSDIHVVYDPSKTNFQTLLPILRQADSHHFIERDGKMVADSWSYRPLPASTELYEKSLGLVTELLGRLHVSKPLVIGVRVENNGSPVIAEVMPNFGLTEHSLVPTALALNGVNLANFLRRTYCI